MHTVVVYKANSESLQSVLGLLRKEGLNPITLENPSAAAALSGCGKATYLINVAVPKDEAAAAKTVLRKWDEAQRPKVKRLIDKLAGPFILSIILIAILTIIFLLAGILADAAALLFVIWLVLFALAANTERLTRRTNKSP